MMRISFSRNAFTPQLKHFSYYQIPNIKDVIFKIIYENKFTTFLISVSIFIIIMCFIFPPTGRIIPVGPEMNQAYSLLISTKTGQDLVSRVKSNTRGISVYLFLGSTSENDLVDPAGNRVRGVTKTYYDYFNHSCIPRGIIIYTNSDITNNKANEIVKSMSFELENVIYSVRYPRIDFGKDSPEAPRTQKQICKELGI